MARQTAVTAFPRQRSTWAWLIATFFGAGLLRPGPGTYGSAAAVLLWCAATYAFHPTLLALSVGTLLAAMLAVVIGIPAATRVARESGREDPGHIVIDEVAGQWIALIGLSPTWPHAVLAFLLFRALDILKPPPVRQLERLPAGTGVVLDDVAAGLLALACAHLLLHFYK